MTIQVKVCGEHLHNIGKVLYVLIFIARLSLESWMDLNISGYTGYAKTWMFFALGLFTQTFHRERLKVGMLF